MPATTRIRTCSPLRFGDGAVTRTSGTVTARPTSMTQPSVDQLPISRDARAEPRSVVAQRTAVTRPRTIASTDPAYGSDRVWRSVVQSRPPLIPSASVLGFPPGALDRPLRALIPPTRPTREVHPLAKTPRTWTGART